MMNFKRTSFTFLVNALIFQSLTPLIAEAAHQVMGSKHSEESKEIEGNLITVTIPDLHQTLNAVQKIADDVLPDMHRIDVKKTFGSTIGDPELKGIPMGGGAAYINTGIFTFWVLECSPEMGEALKPILSRQGLSTVTLHGKLFALGSPMDSGLFLETGGLNPIAQAMADKLLSSDETGLFVTIKTSEIIQTYSPFVEMGIQMLSNRAMGVSGLLPEMMDSLQFLSRISEGYFRLMVNLVSQIETVGVSLRPEKERIHLDVRLVAERDSAMSKFLQAPNDVNVDSVHSIENLSEGTLEFEMISTKPRALVAWVKQEVDVLAEQMVLSDEVVVQLDRAIETLPVFMHGSLLKTVQVTDARMTLEAVMSVDDEKGFREALSMVSDQMKPISKVYRDIGLPFEIKYRENVRTIENNQVDSYSFKFITEDRDPNITVSIGPAGLPHFSNELMVREGFAYWAADDRSLDTLVERIESGEKGSAVLESRKSYPDGGWLYVDVDLAPYLSVMKVKFKDEEVVQSMKGLADALEGVPPMVSAGFTQQDEVHVLTSFPVEIFKTLVNQFMNTVN